MATEKEVVDFYNKNWVRIIYEFVTNNGQSKTFNDFRNVVTYEPVRLLVNPAKTSLTQEFEAHLMDGTITPESYRFAIENQVDAERIYKEFWYNPDNMKRAKELTLKLPDPNSELGKRHAKVVAVLKTMINPFMPIRPAYTIQSHVIPQTDMNISDMQHYSSYLKVEFVRKWFLGSIPLQILNWWFQLNIQRFTIYDNKKPVGDMYLILKHGVNPFTLPLMKGTSIVVTAPNFNLIHESVHSVQYAFQSYWNIPRELVEIPAMCLENIARKDHNCELSKEQINRQAALALADLTTETPEDFNQAYEKFLRITNAGHIRAKMPHVVTNPQTYYGYVLGWARVDKSMLSQAVRDPKYIESMVFKD